MPSRRTGRAALILAGLALIGLAVGFTGLGNWQLRRAAERDALTAQFADAAKLPALEVPPTNGEAAESRYRRLQLTGRYVPGVQVLLDNMTHDGVAGYEVLTPFRPMAGGPAVVVNRGWIPADPNRAELPAIAVGAEPRTVRGRIDRLPVPALRLAAPEPAPEAVRVMSFPTIAELEHELGLELAPFQLRLDADAADGYLRDFEPATGMSSRRNRVYAGQWYLMAAGALVAGLALLVRNAAASAR
jgi:surfeit locus 1 family protein